MRPLRARTLSRILLAAALLIAVPRPLSSETDIPTFVPPEPTLTVTADTGTGEVVLSWTSTATPYAVVRSTNPDFFGNVSPSIIGSGLPGPSFRDLVLTDGNLYFYSIEDVNTATQVYSMSATAALRGLVNRCVNELRRQPPQSDRLS